jgi:hypothetical protein
LNYFLVSGLLGDALSGPFTTCTQPLTQSLEMSAVVRFRTQNPTVQVPAPGATAAEAEKTCRAVVTEDVE